MDLRLWTSLVTPHVNLIEKKWGHLAYGFWKFAYQQFPQEVNKMEELEQRAWRSFQNKEGVMSLRLKVTAYFDAFNNLCEKVTKNETWRSPGSAGESNSEPPF